jgi:GNAT superfamily N-acetyltransferase
MDIKIIPLTAALADEYLKFFDGPAFSDNPDWAGCYCCFYHICSPEWEQRTGEQNREFAREAIANGSLNGYLAFIGNEPVGWVNAGKRESYARLAAEPLPEGDNICSVVCFTISPFHRRQGVAAKLLQAVIDGAKGKYDYIEAYPLKGKQTAAFHYHGPLAMYEAAGFEAVSETKKYYVVRLGL